jgi:hypothetical protein
MHFHLFSRMAKIAAFYHVPIKIYPKNTHGHLSLKWKLFLDKTGKLNTVHLVFI